MLLKATNITLHSTHVERIDREDLLKQRGCTIWFTGLPSSGKSTTAFSLEHELIKQGYLAYVLDGDNIRHGLNNNLGFSPEDRVENIRRIAEVAKLFRDAGVISLTAFISPYQADREGARKLAEAENDAFIEVFVDCSIEVCEQRDPKGMYKKARAGTIRDFTGISAPYEAPDKPEIHLRTDQMSVENCVQGIMKYLIDRNYIPYTPNRMQSTYFNSQSSSV